MQRFVKTYFRLTQSERTKDILKVIEKVRAKSDIKIFGHGLRRQRSLQLTLQINHKIYISVL